eukprot:1905769-Pyramimonas_sp.AAC.1
MNSTGAWDWRVSDEIPLGRQMEYQRILRVVGTGAFSIELLLEKYTEYHAILREDGIGAFPID